MSEGLSEVGQARAWIHLALEKKMLSQHLKELLTNQELLRSMFTQRFTSSKLCSQYIPGFLRSDSCCCLSGPLTGSCTNLTHSCSVKKKGSSFCSTCSLSTLWTTSASHASSPPSVSTVNFDKKMGEFTGGFYSFQGHWMFSRGGVCVLQRHISTHLPHIPGIPGIHTVLNQ